ncbi:hypothetical protein [Pseudomonas baltica]|uniref:hypothetical protein n=1 Tax=Pseudomonas baltica TaxID=2762576 RepID=UPI00289FF328|nr:hypothetical protein [Pseudomonas baltica]
MKNRRWLIYSFLALMCIFFTVFMLFVRSSITHESSVSFMSDSGDYRLDSVRVAPPFTFRSYAYLRLTEVQHPARVYRSPLMDADSLEMVGFETPNEVGVAWLTFYKSEHRFRVTIPQWTENWLNIFISNTPYEASSDD